MSSFFTGNISIYSSIGLSILDIFVGVFATISTIMHLRSLVKSAHFAQIVRTFFQQKFNHKLKWKQILPLFNMWFVAVILSNCLATVGALLRLIIAFRVYVVFSPISPSFPPSLPPSLPPLLPSFLTDLPPSLPYSHPHSSLRPSLYTSLLSIPLSLSPSLPLFLSPSLSHTLQPLPSIAVVDIASIIVGLAVFAQWCGVLRFLSYFDHYNMLLLTLRISLPSVLRFTVCAGILYFAFLLCGWLVLGAYHPKVCHRHTTIDRAAN